jgi:hypothetical protein
MIVETLRQYIKSAEHEVPKTLLAKLIYLVDFAWFYNELKPMSGMKYRRDQYGPVPDQFFKTIDTMVDNGEIKLTFKDITGRTKQMQALGIRDDLEHEPNQYLSEKEIILINKVVQKWKNADVDEIVEFTHHQLPWQITRPNEFIPYELITQEEPSNVF